MSVLTPYFEEDGIVLYHGDCRDILPKLGQADHVITDPPYDATTHGGIRNPLAKNELVVSFPPFDVAAGLPLLLEKSKRWTLCFCSLEMLGEYKRVAGFQWVRAGFWRRPNGAPQFSGDRPAQPGEGIAIMHRFFGYSGRLRWNGGGKHGFWDVPVVQRGRVHPTQKPLALLEALIRDFTQPKELLLDPFAGYGTTLAAAVRLGRRCVGIEIDEAWCEQTAVRLTRGEG